MGETKTSDKLRHASSNEDSNDPIFFWKPEEPHGYFCQWYLSTFTEDDITFNCCEQYMMYHKAKTFNDTEAMAAILKESRPRKQKALGRKVEGFTDEKWDRVKFDTVVQANHLKFGSSRAGPTDNSAHPSEKRADHGESISLRHLLLSTGDRELAEASGFDRVWGIGYKAEEARGARQSWGQNLLGKALMEVRRRLKEAAKIEDEG